MEKILIKPGPIERLTQVLEILVSFESSSERNVFCLLIRDACAMPNHLIFPFVIRFIPPTFARHSVETAIHQLRVTLTRLFIHLFTNGRANPLAHKNVESHACCADRATKTPNIVISSMTRMIITTPRNHREEIKEDRVTRTSEVGANGVGSPSSIMTLQSRGRKRSCIEGGERMRKRVKELEERRMADRYSEEQERDAESREEKKSRRRQRNSIGATNAKQLDATFFVIINNTLFDAHVKYQDNQDQQTPSWLFSYRFLLLRSVSLKYEMTHRRLSNFITESDFNGDNLEYRASANAFALLLSGHTRRSLKIIEHANARSQNARKHLKGETVLGMVQIGNSSKLISTFVRLALPFRWPSGSGIRVGIYWKKEAESADVAISLPTASVRNEPSQNTLVPRGNQKEEKEKNLAGQTQEKEDEDHDDDDHDDDDGDEDDAALLSLFALKPVTFGITRLLVKSANDTRGGFLTRWLTARESANLCSFSYSRKCFLAHPVYMRARKKRTLDETIIITLRYGTLAIVRRTRSLVAKVLKYWSATLCRVDVEDRKTGKLYDTSFRSAKNY
ncbi:hypothetical protein WN51_12181 [Melipona quadrifasciata]|uniref:Uncharacterized protein n=1 Tax=Melipona quadrifasciata TaxID=166423 RepID=A0A0M9A1S1_9HYME|nr:hypothetical protein WN51_12181 [Melipona quadrifasciata]